MTAYGRRRTLRSFAGGNCRTIDAGRAESVRPPQDPARPAVLVLPRALAADLPALPHHPGRLESRPVVPVLVAAQGGRARGLRSLRGPAVRRGVLAGAVEHPDRHRQRPDRHRPRARTGAAGQCRHPRPRRLSHHHFPVLSADDGRGRHHLALDVRREGRPHQLHGAPARSRRQADPLSQFLHLGAALGHRRQYLADPGLLHDHPADRAAEHPARAARGGGDRRRRRLPSLPAHHPATAAAFALPGLRDRHAELDHQLRPGLRHDRRRPRPRHRDPRHLHLQAGLRADQVRRCRRRHHGLLRAAAGHRPGPPIAWRAAMSARRTPSDEPLSALADPSRADAGRLRHAGAVLLGAEDQRVGREHLCLPALDPAGQGQPLLLRRCLVRDPVRALFPEQRDRLGDRRGGQRRLQRHGGLCAEPRLPRQERRRPAVPRPA